MRSASTKLPMVTHVIVEPLQKNESAIAVAT